MSWLTVYCHGTAYLFDLVLVATVGVTIVIVEGLRAGKVVIRRGRSNDVSLASDLASEACNGTGHWAKDLAHETGRRVWMFTRVQLGRRTLVDFAEKGDAGELALTALAHSFNEGMMQHTH